MKFLKRIRTNYIYGKHRKQITRALQALQFIEYHHLRLQWSRRKRRQWWRDFVYSPEARNQQIMKYLLEVQKPKKYFREMLNEKTKNKR